jgi:hypothetical protein
VIPPKEESAFADQKKALGMTTCFSRVMSQYSAAPSALAHPAGAAWFIGPFSHLAGAAGEKSSVGLAVRSNMQTGSGNPVVVPFGFHQSEAAV